MEASDFNTSVWFNIKTNDIASREEFASIKKDLHKQELMQGFWVEVNCECTDTEEEDIGIGEYEFWGSTYYDDRTETRPTDFIFTIEGSEVVGIIPTEKEMDELEEYELTKEQEEVLLNHLVESEWF